MLNEGKKPMLGEPKETIQVLQKHDFHFQKKFGQNFLIDTRVLEKIVSAAEIGKEDVVLEIGPGIGTLTQYLAYHAKKVVAVEIDDHLIPILKETLKDYPNAKVIHQDILKINLHQFIEEDFEGKKIKVVANLPYYITTPIIMNLFESGIPMDCMVIMVQEEVARRMETGPGNKDYGALSLAVQYYAKPYIAAYVPQNCFMPRPKIGSAVITLKKHEVPPVEVEDERLMFDLIHASFNQRRKTLVNGIKNSGKLNFLKEDIEKAVEEAGFDLRVRGEALTLSEFARLANILEKYK